MTDEIITKAELKKLRDMNIKFTEDYRRGVHENWGGRPIAVYEILYRIMNSGN